MFSIQYSLNGAPAFSIFNTGATLNNAGGLNGSTTFLGGVSDDIFVNNGVILGTVAMVEGNHSFTNAVGDVVNGIVDLGGVGDNAVTLPIYGFFICRHSPTGPIYGSKDLCRCNE